MKNIFICFIFIFLVACNKKVEYENLALNAKATHDFQGIYPYAFSNSETRGEKAYWALNAINGNTYNTKHGDKFPSWGPQKDIDSAFWQVDFGDTIIANELVIYIRADFPHDGYWNKAKIVFSDNSNMDIELKKTAEPQKFILNNKKTAYIRIEDLIQAMPDTWCALTEVEVWGISCKKADRKSK